MAKKGGAQQLQADITTDDDLYKFLERPGVLVLDVYSEWCGPCLAMVGSLKKIKLELGGDSLHLAICKSDTIEALKRFRNKSEPTWLFATQGKCVNLMFGTDVPKLMKIITDELNNLDNPKRTFYRIDELQPEEVTRKQIEEKQIADALNKEIEEAARQKLEYLTYVTNEIMSNLPDIGVSIFGPHINRDVYKKIMEVAETQKISCKDRRTGPVFPEQFELIDYFCENPIDPEVLEHMFQKDLLVCFWKVAETEVPRAVEETLQNFVHELTHPRKVVLDTGDIDPSQTLPPLLKPLEIKIARPLEGAPEKESSQPTPDVQPQVEDPITELIGQEAIPGEEVEETENENDNENENENEESEAKKESVSEKPESIPSVESLDTQVILVPPVWVPSDIRTHAMLIYVFFRAQTTSFLPPDPIPDPPHIVMAFDAHKKKDIFQVIEKHKENVLLYGFFTNHDPQSAKLIADSLKAYETTVPQVTDKLVLKVAKNTSHTMLAFAEFGPSYVSVNTVVGKEEALKLFPEGFKNVEPVEEEKVVVQEAETSKKKKSSKSKTEPAKEPPKDPES